MGVLSSAYAAQSGPPNAYPTNTKQGGTGGSSSRTSSSVPSIGLGSVPGPSSRPPTVPNSGDLIVKTPGVDYANALTSTFNGLMASYASQMAGFRNSVGAANRQLAYQPALYGNSRNAETNTYNQGMQNLWLNRVGNAIDQNAAQRDNTYYGDVYNNTLKGYLTNYDYVNKQQGIRESRFRRGLGLPESAAGQVDPGLRIPQRGIRQLPGRRRHGRAGTCSADPRAAGHRRRRLDLRRPLRQGPVGLHARLYPARCRTEPARFGQRLRVRAGRHRQDRTKLQTGYGASIAGLDNQRANMNIDLERAGLDRNQQQAQANDRLQQLQLEAGRYSVDENALQANLQNQLERLGLENQLSTGQLLGAIRNGNAQQQQLAQQIFMQAVANTPRSEALMDRSVEALINFGAIDCWTKPGTRVSGIGITLGHGSWPIQPGWDKARNRQHRRLAEPRRRHGPRQPGTIRDDRRVEAQAGDRVVPVRLLPPAQAVRARPRSDSHSAVGAVGPRVLRRRRHPA